MRRPHKDKRNAQRHLSLKGIVWGRGWVVAQMLRSISVQQLLSRICTCAMLRCVLFEKPWSCSSKVCLTFQPKLQRKPPPADRPACPLLALTVCPPRCSPHGRHYCPCCLPCLSTPDYHLPACRWNCLPRCLLHWWKCSLLLSQRC